MENEEIIDAAKKAFRTIPDHERVSDGAVNYMTRDLYVFLCAAWDVPVWVSGDIGNEEFLSYFVTGNGGSFVRGVESARIVSRDGNSSKVELIYSQVWNPGDTEATMSKILVTMVKERGKWLLDNFGNDTKGQCRWYISTEVSDYLSGKTLRHMKENQRGEWYTDRYISTIAEKFDAYISKYRNFLDEKLGIRV